MFKTVKTWAAILTLAVMVAGCSDDDENPVPQPDPEPQPKPVPELKANFESPLKVDPAGGELKLPFTILNGAEDGKLSATCDQDWLWVSGMLVGLKESTVETSVLPNELADDRKCNMMVKYTYDGSKELTFPVEVVQNTLFRIEILEERHDGVKVRVSPLDEEMFYVAAAVSQETFDNYESPEKYIEDELKYLRAMCDVFGDTMLSILDEVGGRGVKEIEVSTIPSQTACYFYVFGATYEDDPKVLTPLIKKGFTTK